MALDPLARRSRRFAVSSDWGWDGVVHALRGVVASSTPCRRNSRRVQISFRFRWFGALFLDALVFGRKSVRLLLNATCSACSIPKAALANGKHSTVWCLCFQKKRTGWLEAGTGHLTGFCLVVSRSAAEPTLLRALELKVAYLAFVRLFWDTRDTIYTIFCHEPLKR